MRTFKIAFVLILLAVAFLTVSGTESNDLKVTNKKEIKQVTKYDLMAHTKSKLGLPPQG
ncbi:hypothetical protein [Aegicerativicinus sediminis]|uniref:hypothetical protein n=1 Tax=Aegicerativicinus sediminis TaxID=2893202 RepID=UPI001E388E05|nr:hypothetical protein [Aegicerativicinus sediminis]